MKCHRYEWGDKTQEADADEHQTIALTVGQFAPEIVADERRESIADQQETQRLQVEVKIPAPKDAEKDQALGHSGRWPRNLPEASCAANCPPVHARRPLELSAAAQRWQKVTGGASRNQLLRRTTNSVTIIMPDVRVFADYPTDAASSSRTSSS